METSELIGEMVPFLQRRGYDPGERIPAERELASRFGVSRGQVREALCSLEVLRVIERRPKSGIFMAPGRPSVEALALFAQIGIPLNAEDVRQTVEMRRIHEVEAIRLACQRRSDANLLRMEEILRTTQEDGDDETALAHHDHCFHSEIVRATQNDIFLRMADIFYLMTTERRAAYLAHPGRRQRSAGDHQRMLDAIASRDVSSAVDATHAHLEGVATFWQGVVDAGESLRADRPGSFPSAES